MKDSRESTEDRPGKAFQLIRRSRFRNGWAHSVIGEVQNFAGSEAIPDVEKTGRVESEERARGLSEEML
jgi:hypothetical protein